MEIIIDTDTNICTYNGVKIVLDNWELVDIQNVIIMANAAKEFDLSENDEGGLQ